MSTLNRQNSLLVAEDWKKVYQTFRNADFQSYDFETLRKSMIDYLRLYYPEDFNDFIESSEYIALIDLIAFLGQSLAFRTDLNARENFLDTAERRDSVLKLARLVSYYPKRSTSSSGLLKINSVTTSEAITDSNGINLANLVVSWNDSTNSNWLEQFSLIFNAALINSQVIGKPGNSQVINSIKTDEYAINLTAGTVPTFPFDATVGGTGMTFEAVSASTMNQPYVYEVNPRPTGRFNILYRNDSKGNGSNNTGFFLFFKQGTLQSVDFSLGESVPNRVLNVGFNNINNSDIWLYDLNSNKSENTLWKAVPAIAGVNVIYNKSTDRNLYQVNTREGDQVDLVFGDGSFANVPQGNYRIYFRTSAGTTYKITPDEIQNATITMNYVSRTGNVETLTIRANLNYSVTNATSNETINDIRQKAPQQYYSQGRMITGEDYNLVPYTSFSNILKVKAVNRTSSGISRFLDVNDSSGKYSSTNIFAQDGHLFKEELIKSLTFSFLTTSSLQQVVQDDLTTILSTKELQHFFYSNFRFPYTQTRTTWNLSSLNTNESTGYFYGYVTDTDPDTHITTTNKQILQVGNVTTNLTKHIRVGAIIKFKAGNFANSYSVASSLINIVGTGIGASFTVTNAAGVYNVTKVDAGSNYYVADSIKISGADLGGIDGVNDIVITITKVTGSNGISEFVISGQGAKGKYFDSQNQIRSGAPSQPGDKMYIYSSVVQVIGDGTNGGVGNFANGQGPISLTQKVPDGAIIEEIIPAFKNSFLQATINEVADKILAYNNFALRYDTWTALWEIVREEKINKTDPFNLGTAGSSSDSSWLIRFEYSNNVGYTIYWRGLNYYFESKLETKFYFDDKVKVFDSKTGTVIRDEIKILKINTSPNETLPLGIDYTWNIYKNIIEVDGYENQNKVLVTFTDTNVDGIPDNPDLFGLVVDSSNLVFFQKVLGYDSFITYTPFESSLIEVDYPTQNALLPNLSLYFAGQLFYTTVDKKFFRLEISSTGEHSLLEFTNNEYLAKVGRENLYFQYRHNSPGYRRIDPSPNNIIDLFMLTSTYATDYQAWIRDTTNTIVEPLPPSTEQLKLEYSQLDNYKAISDTIIFNSAKFKSLFGAKSELLLQATFKVVKNATLNISNNDIKSSVVNAINTYFAVNNWDFGETFYFSELSAYLHTALSPNVSSIIIVPKDPSSLFGSLYQINAEADEILTSSATVDNVEIISAITASQINANYAGVNSTVTLGSTQ
jgi:hypothetical protein